ncbi:MAG TPA: tRNA (N(6)-L-threonylcarbamoyladenosine(37)-C(2))-methylthiotransferase MtaB [Synergistaceae bacterium]|nr:tRNA (N(6)-L-threonylcarbamoyladenosine(37)-C(2))-methylthiotransferase MtaB [Synergistaceae bacterium]
MDALTDKTYSVHIQGCRTNQYEGEAIAASLEKAGAVQSPDDPDITVIVSCTITAAADRKCRKLIRKMRRENPDSLIIACGCYAQRMSDSDRAALGVDILIGNRMKHKIAELASDWFTKKERGPYLSVFDDDIMTDGSWDGLLLDRPRLHTRAFLKVQDGCSHFCSYCIVPYVRGNPVSRNVKDALAEAEMIVQSGCPEIVLTGVHLGLHEDLPQLVRKIGSIKGLKRLRFGSIEPFAVDERLLESIADTETFCRHLHIPLQSGDDGVLANMRRGYTTKGFRVITDNIRNKLGDDVHLSTDLMVGFPGEDETAFENSMRFTKDIGFGKMHIFNYSPREGTDAARMTCPPEKEVKKRLEKALTQANALHWDYCSKWIGKDVEILVEQKINGIVRGLARNYIRVAALSENAKIGEELRVTPQKYMNGILTSDFGSKCSQDNSEFPEFL